MTSRPRNFAALARMQAKCERFNQTYKVGDEIVVYFGLKGENPQTVRIRHPAQVLSGHTPVVYVDGGRGCVALTHVKRGWAGPEPLPTPGVRRKLLEATEERGNYVFCQSRQTRDALVRAGYATGHGLGVTLTDKGRAMRNHLMREANR